MRRAPSQIAGELFGAEPRRRLALLKAAWPAAVGPELARRSEVVALDGEVLRVRVSDATWRRGLWRMRGDLKARLRDIVGRVAPHALSFVEGLVTPPPEREGPQPAASPPGPLPAAVADAAEAIPDEEVRRRFCDAAMRYLSRFTDESQTEDEGGELA